MIGPWVIGVGESESGYKSRSKVKIRQVCGQRSKEHRFSQLVIVYQCWYEDSWTLGNRDRGVQIWVQIWGQRSKEHFS